MPSSSLPSDLERTIDRFVERWYRRDMDIGQTSIMGIPVDLMPDRVEKHLYKKLLLALFTMLHESRPTLSVMGIDLELRLRAETEGAPRPPRRQD